MSQYPTPGEVPRPGQFTPEQYDQRPQYDQGQYGQQQYPPPGQFGPSPSGQQQYPPPPGQFGPSPSGQQQYPPPGQFGPSPYGQQFYPPARVAKPTGWFVVNWLFFWPSAIYSLVSHWNKIDAAAYSGDLAGAQLHAAKVKKLGIIALCIGILIIMGQVAYYSTMAGTMTSY